ncbi:hypothetical protein SteCoe_13423 [Stentor coeruleus]|uniref:C2H2-type domain-containing protein n=1 Tax=Stentor coeruleus TaxID=5963 RepID=A0A1R2C8K7_9CILI|nr:hypothetical protein SteCoe_13423 [Stentor coeruleus]
MAYINLKAMRALFVCSHPNCGKSYVNSSILKRHIQAFHNAEKRFQCSFCGKCLASRQNLKEHTFTHTGEKPYACPVPGCNASFRQGTHLSAHKRMEHSQPSDATLINVHSQYNMDLGLLTQLISKLPLIDETSLPEVNLKFNLPPIGRSCACKLPNLC